MTHTKSNIFDNDNVIFDWGNGIGNGHPYNVLDDRLEPGDGRGNDTRDYQEGNDVRSDGDGHGIATGAYTNGDGKSTFKNEMIIQENNNIMFKTDVDEYIYWTMSSEMQRESQ